MDAANVVEPRRVEFALKDGVMAGLDFGDPARPYDLVFVHANGFNAKTYQTLLAPLAQGRRSWRDLGDDVAELVAKLGHPVWLAGHSMGGTSSLLAAAKVPHQVKGLVLFDPVIMPRLFILYASAPWHSAETLAKRVPIARQAAGRRAVFASPEAAFQAYKGRGAFKSWPDQVLADYLADGLKPMADGQVELACAPAWEASNFASQGHDPWAAARRYPGPIHILRAEHGSTCKVGDGAALMRRNRRLSLKTVAGTSHFLPMERPDLFREALLSALGHHAS
jgi:pimeloyl-ACP methyl ester carboxylesterase